MATRAVEDAEKAAGNPRKHRVSIETAARVFLDPFAVLAPDRIEGGEYRWETTGIVEGHLLLVVAHTFPDDDDGCEIIRIISARKAEPREKTL